MASSSRTIHDDAGCRVVLFSFAAGQQLSDHTAAVPVTIEVVDGDADIGVAGENISAPTGTWLHLEADTPHSVLARTPITLLLTLIKQARLSGAPATLSWRPRTPSDAALPPGPGAGPPRRRRSRPTLRPEQPT